MVNNPETIKTPTEAEEQKSPLEEMPSFEEHLKTLEEFGSPAKNSLAYEPFGNPIEKPVDDDVSGIVENKQEKTDLVDKASSLEGQSMAYMPFGQPVEKQQEEPKDEEKKPDEEEKLNEEEKPDEEQEKRKEKLEDTLSEIQRNLEAAKADMLEDVSVFDKVTAQMQELLEDRKMNMDLDELNTSLIKLQRAADELATSNSRFRAWNTEYGGAIINGRNILDEGEYRDREKGVYDNIDLVSRNNRKLDEATERIAEIRKYIRAVEEAYDAFR